MSWGSPIEYVIRGLGSIMYEYCIVYIYILMLLLIDILLIA